VGGFLFVGLCVAVLHVFYGLLLPKGIRWNLSSTQKNSVGARRGRSGTDGTPYHRVPADVLYEKELSIGFSLPCLRIPASISCSRRYCMWAGPSGLRCWVEHGWNPMGRTRSTTCSLPLKKCWRCRGLSLLFMHFQPIFPGISQPFAYELFQTDTATELFVFDKGRRWKGNNE